jgi:two-component system response regulator|tara:strand:+ start:452 stop:910 length:459 start_codon:yes stop_codon:yes gene_type:complete
MGLITKNGDPINILLVEDNEDDIEITTMAFEEARIHNNLYVVRNGQDGWEYINRQGKYADEEKYPAPDLILLDINMPKMGGFELLEKLKADEKLKLIPAVMLTSSKNEEDVVKSYFDGAAAYIPKPVNHEEFLKVVEAFNFFWQIVKLPKKS